MQEEQLKDGVVACDLVGLGWSATDKILESPRGFFQAHGGGYNLNSIKGQLGRPWTFSKTWSVYQTSPLWIFNPSWNDKDVRTNSKTRY